MAYTNIKKPSDYFNGKTYLGSASAVTVTGLDFQPDLVWVKDRDNGNNHCLVDAVRGAGKYISSDLTSAETDNATNSISAFNSDGFTTGTANPANEAASTTKGFMSWNWKANGTGSANTDGSISSTVSANTTSGFSIVSYTGTGSAATIGHGLGYKPDVIFTKKRSASGNNWGGYFSAIGATKNLTLDATGGADADASYWGNTEPNSTVFTVSTNGNNNASGVTYIAYCFHNIQGYSKFGSYTGNGSTDGTFVYTGFKPSWVMIKNTSTSNDWFMIDNSRDTLAPNNPVGRKSLFANTSGAEVTRTTKDMDFLSNGIKLRTADGTQNNSGENYIYMAFAEQPLVGDNPATAR